MRCKLKRVSLNQRIEIPDEFNIKAIEPIEIKTAHITIRNKTINADRAVRRAFYGNYIDCYERNFFKNTGAVNYTRVHYKVCLNRCRVNSEFPDKCPSFQKYIEIVHNGIRPKIRERINLLGSVGYLLDKFSNKED